MRWKRIVGISLAVLLAAVGVPTLSALWSRQKLEAHRAEIRRIDGNDSNADRIDLERRTGIHFTVRRLDQKPGPEDICASIRPLLCPLGWWVIDHDGRITWMTRADLDAYYAKRGMR